MAFLHLRFTYLRFPLARRELKTCIRALLFAFAANTLISCGGGSEGRTDFALEIATGQFKDSNVEGLSYVSGSQRGITDALGTFSYEVGNTVTFSIGNVILGTAEGGSIVTPLDLVPEGTFLDQRVLNIVSFLLALDEDRNGDNGIRISETAATLAENWPNLNLSLLEVTAEEFAAQPFSADLVPLISELASSLSDDVVFLDRNQITQHFLATLRCTQSGVYYGQFSGDNAGNFAFISGSLFGTEFGEFFRESRSLREPGIFILGDAPEIFGFTGSPFVAGFTPIFLGEPNFIPPNLSNLPAISIGRNGSGDRFIPGLEFTADQFDQKVIAGTWTEGELSGDFSGQRLGGALDAVHRISTQYVSAEQNLFLAIDLDADNNASGLAFNLETAEVSEVSGRAVGDQLTIRVADGEEIVGTLSFEFGFVSFGFIPFFGTGAIPISDFPEIGFRVPGRLGSLCKLN